MICPDCFHDNIEGVDVCEECGQSLTVFDVGTEFEQSICRHSIRVLVPKSPESVPASTKVRDAIQKMVQLRIGCVLVEDGGKLVGVFTERDVLNRVATQTEALDRPVSEVMTSALETITKEDSIAYALHTMDVGGYRHMPIVDASGRGVGIVSMRDILRFLCVRFAALRARAS